MLSALVLWECYIHTYHLEYLLKYLHSINLKGIAKLHLTYILVIDHVAGR